MPNDPVDLGIITPVVEAILSDVGSPDQTLTDIEFEMVDLAQTDSILLGWGIQVTYRWDYGLRCGPLAAPKNEQQSAYWRMHSGTCFKTVLWASQEFDAVTYLPSSDPVNENEVLVAKIISVLSPQPGIDGRQVITVVGLYEYQLQRAPSDEDLIALPVSPFLPTARTLLQPSQFAQYLLPTYPPPTGFTGGQVNF